MNYYIAMRDEQKGPYTMTQLETMWQAGTITADALYCAEGMTAWASIEELFRLGNPGAAAPEAKSFSDHVRDLIRAIAPVRVWLQTHGHRLVLSLAMTGMIGFSLARAVQQKSLWDAAFMFQGFVPTCLIGSTTFTQLLCIVITLAVVGGVVWLAWRAQRWAVTALACGFLFLSATLAMERIATANKVFALASHSQSKNQAASVLNERSRYTKDAIVTWTPILEERKQKDFALFHNFAGQALSVEIDDFQFAWNARTGTEHDGYTIVYTVAWKSAAQTGRTRIEAVINSSGSKPLVSLRALESTAATTFPLGVNLLSAYEQ